LELYKPNKPNQLLLPQLKFTIPTISMSTYSIAIHGGAGTLERNVMSPVKEAAYRRTLQQSLDIGFSLLKQGAAALDAVEAAVKVMEDSPLFNAGRGSVFTHKGTHEMDASIMDGKTLAAGAVAGISGVRNPIALARLVMEKSGHVLLSGEGAMEFARSENVAMENEKYFYDELRYRQFQEALQKNVTQLDHSPLDEKKFGTVGAVALDKHGNLAAATSTGGMTNKKFGRVGDSPLIGAGNYANNATCAVSCTGSGEFFIRRVVAYDVSCLMEYKGLSLEEACREVVHVRLPEIEGDGGLIAVDRSGQISMPFNTSGMYRGARTSTGINLVEIYQ
jgi:beta-aspartyl-peptidase (threonine type)